MRHQQSFTLDGLRLGMILGWQDYKMLNAGSILGRFWPAIGVALRVAVIGLVFSVIFGARSEEYVSWLASGIISWTMISSAFQSSAQAFISSRTLIHSLSLPLFAFVVSAVVSSCFRWFQNLPLIVVVMFLSPPENFAALFVILPAFLIVSSSLVGSGLVFGVVAARFRDTGPLISSLLGVLFFLLPIMWRPEDLGDGLTRQIAGFNPFYHLLQVLRLPLIGEFPTAVNWLVTILVTLFLLTLGRLMLPRYSSKIALWI